MEADKATTALFRRQADPCSVAIIGAGWLGGPLALQLSQCGHQVYVTRTKPSNLQAMAAQGIAGFVTQLDPSLAACKQQLVADLQQRQIHTLIGTFPPGFRQGRGTEYVQQWQLLVTAARQAGCKRLLMTSATSVYPETFELATEQDASLIVAQDNPQFSDKARLLLQAEQSVIDSGLDYTVIRCAGLFGPHRHPGRFVSKLTSISRHAPANMLHLDDAIGIVCFALKQLNNTVVNATSPVPVSKASFYQAAMEQYDPLLMLPPVSNKPGKLVCSEKVIQLGYQFHFQCATDGLLHCSS